MTGLLEGKVTIVTGGARGVGADICRVLVKHGGTVVVNYSSSRAQAEALIAELGENAMAIAADVRDYAQVEAMVAQVLERFGRVDGVVNNAIAGRQHGPLEEMVEKDYQDMFDFGCKAVINTVRAVRPSMTAQGGGRIVNVVTEVWDHAGPHWTAYLSGKGAMVGISRSLANELGPEGITVNMVAPGWMVTETVDPASEGSMGYAKTVPLRRQASAQEIGKGCLFFLSELGDFVTGAYLPVCGGRVTQMG